MPKIKFDYMAIIITSALVSMTLTMLSLGIWCGDINLREIVERFWQ